MFIDLVLKFVFGAKIYELMIFGVQCLVDVHIQFIVHFVDLCRVLWQSVRT